MSTANEIQWRNIKKVVRAAADLSFGGKDDPKYGHCWLAVVNSLTARDGLDITSLGLEPLPALATAQPVQVNAMLVEALEQAEKLEHEALVALSEATYELKVGNPYTTATDTYKANNDLIHRLDKILNLQYRDRKHAALTAAQQAQPEPAKVIPEHIALVCEAYDFAQFDRQNLEAVPQNVFEALHMLLADIYKTTYGHKQAQPEPNLFEFWWAEYMPDATQEQAFKAWSAAPSSKGVVVGQQAQPERAGLNEAELDLCRRWFNSVQDTNCGYLDKQDYTLAAKIYGLLSMRLPHSIRDVTAQAIKQGGQHD